ncbi:MAG TPA: DNA repair protein RecN [Solirubrobacteraceae bacterium]|nr:DNA repair protein RecN [Solirubrobacteraceae bacterium]
MLRELRVENLLLIERAELRLAPGLNVLTGETGAGKTVLAHALDLLLGGRARPGIVRPGASEAYVEGVFDLPARLREQLGERSSADAEEVVLARTVGSDGRTRARLGGRSATVADLREIGGALLAFYGQHEHRRLTLAAAQLEILDGMIGAAQAGRRDACSRALARRRRLHERLVELGELAGQRERELDLLDFELAEIDSLAPQEDEHARLLAVRDRVRRLDALRSAAGAGVQALVCEDAQTPGAATLLAGPASLLDGLAGLDPALDGLAERMRGLIIECQELAGELRDYEERTGVGDQGAPDGALADGEVSLDSLEERLARKHGGSIASVLEFAVNARARREELTGVEGELGRVGVELGHAQAELDACVAELRREREAAAVGFAEAVREQLAALAMGDATFEVALSEQEPGPSGGDAVEFLIAPNPGVPAAPLRDVASGGELSRVMLAIMGVANASSGDSTLVFDEVDAGIGGQTARAVGARLRELADRRQVLCITHLPQIASLGARHFSIVKDTTADPTRATVVELGEGEVLSELVRMLGADTDDGGARRHARELRRAA